MIFDEETLANVSIELFDAYRKYRDGDSDALGEGYKCSVKHTERIQLHSKGEKCNPRLTELLELARPNEQQAVKDYRIGSWLPPTKSHFGRVKNSLFSIYDKRNYSISWPNEKDANAETFRAYLTIGFPKWKSLVGYFERFLFHKTITDPNSAVLIYPLPEADNSKLRKPFPFWFSSDKILYLSDEYAIFADNHGPNGENEMYIADHETVWYAVERKENDRLQWYFEEIFRHGLGMLPVVKVPGEKHDEGDSLGEYGEDYQLSYIHPVLDPWDKAVLKSTDQDGTEILHQSPKYWHYKQPCKTCEGKRTVSVATAYKGKSVETNCAACSGTGWQRGDGPYDTIALDVKKVTDGLSTPPGGFISPDAQILEYGKKRVDDWVGDGYASINMQHLLNQVSPAASGERVFQDKTEANKFLLQVSSGLWECYRQIEKITAMEMFGPAGIYNERMLSLVQEPIEFDVYTSADITAKYSAAKTAGADPAYLAMLQAEAIKKEFGETSYQAKSFELNLKLDPLANITGDDLLTLKPWLRDEDVWLHANIKRIIQTAIIQNKQFMEMDLQKQQDIVYAIVTTEIAARKKSVLSAEPADDPNNPGGQA